MWLRLNNFYPTIRLDDAKKTIVLEQSKILSIFNRTILYRCFLCPKLIRERMFVMVIWYVCRSQPVKKTWGKAGSKPIQKQEEQKPAEPISLKKATPIDKAPIEKTKVNENELFRKNPSNVPHQLNLHFRWQLLRLIRIIFEWQNALIVCWVWVQTNSIVRKKLVASLKL